MTTIATSGAFHRSAEELIERLTRPTTLFFLFVFSILMFYGLAPFALHFALSSNEYYLELSGLAVVAATGLLLGFNFQFFDDQILNGPKLHLNSTLFHWLVWGAFSVYFVAVFATASSIPLISALFGADTEQLSVERGDFLKLRDGFEASYQYIDTLFMGFLLPYSLALMVIERRRAWPVALVYFLFYSVSSLQKALFLRALAPLGFLVAQRKVGRPLRFVAIIAVSSVLILLGNVALERGITAPDEAPAEHSFAPDASSTTSPADLQTWVDGYFDPLYVRSGIVDQVVWRIIAVPIFTAADAVAVFHEELAGRLLWGATSTPIAAVLGHERVNLDSMVFAHQWGESDIGRSNSVFFVELFVNFGWPGVLIISMLIGMTFRWFSISPDYAFRSTITIYMIALFSSGLIGILLSNGFALLFLVGLFGDISRSKRQT